MSDDSYDDNSPSSGSRPRRRGTPFSFSTLMRAARWETFAIVAVLFVLAFVFA